MKEIKLIKFGEHYDLYHRIAEENLIIGFASTDNTFENKLSLKNCQAIELGYDLDKLAESYANYMNDDGTSDIDFKVGFQKALEILGDKKFSEDDVNLAFVLGKNKDESRINKLINSKLQQTEWNVIIEMEDSFTKNDEVYVDETNAKGNYSNHSKKPLLDVDGCLILKRKI